MQIIRIAMVRLLYYIRRFADLVIRSVFLISFSARKMIFLSLSDVIGKYNLHYKIHAVIQLIKERRNMKQNDYFIEESERVIQERTADGQFYILYTDITDFHLVNYIYGNEIGDSLLQEMNHFLDSRPNILLCRRLFADFFVGLYFLENGQEISEIISGLDRELQEFLTDLQSRYPACRLKAACGLCLIEHDNIAQAIDNANLARKISKNQYSFKTVVYDHSMKDQITAVHENELEIYNALHENRFCFYLQPKVDLTNGMIIGAEALARRIGDDGTVIPPDKFMDLMEAKGSVIELDQIICRQVCEFLKDRMDRGLSVVCISVNLSRLHIRNPESADVFHQIAAEYGIPPELLEFELTETILLEEFAGAKHLIDQLRAYGHHVSIDDFGSGYAGINVWQELNFDCLKLDRKFLSDDELLKNAIRRSFPILSTSPTVSMSRCCVRERKRRNSVSICSGWAAPSCRDSTFQNRCRRRNCARSVNARAENIRFPRCCAPISQNTSPNRRRRRMTEAGRRVRLKVMLSSFFAVHFSWESASPVS